MAEGLHRSEYLDVIHEKLSDFLLSINTSYDTCTSPDISLHMSASILLAGIRLHLSTLLSRAIDKRRRLIAIRGSLRRQLLHNPQLTSAVQHGGHIHGLRLDMTRHLVQSYARQTGKASSSHVALRLTVKLMVNYWNYRIMQAN